MSISVRDVHRSRRPRRACFGELVQMDASIHDWLEEFQARLTRLARFAGLPMRD